MADIGTTSRSDRGYRMGSAVVTRTRGADRADRGASFIEVLVAVVLIGLSVVAVMAALRATVIATTLERDHAKAQQWLQAASEVVEDQNYGDCDTVPLSGSQIQTAYQTAVETFTTEPYGFTGGTITVSEPEVWDGSRFVSFASQSTCYDDVLLRQQRVTITVRSPDGDIIESVQVIKKDRV